MTLDDGVVMFLAALMERGISPAQFLESAETAARRADPTLPVMIPANVVQQYVDGLAEADTLVEVPEVVH